MQRLPGAEGPPGGMLNRSTLRLAAVLFPAALESPRRAFSCSQRAPFYKPRRLAHRARSQAPSGPRAAPRVPRATRLGWQYSANAASQTPHFFLELSLRCYETFFLRENPSLGLSVFLRTISAWVGLPSRLECYRVFLLSFTLGIWPCLVSLCVSVCRSCVSSSSVSRPPTHTALVSSPSLAVLLASGM